MKRILFFLLIVISSSSYALQDLTIVVNPLVGTDGHGHTFPGPTLPFGMVQVSPDTRVDGWDGCSGYHYTDRTIYGFSHTHLSGTGCSDYGDILLMPTVGTPKFTREEYSSKFKKNDQQARVGYYSVLLENKVKVELTATMRTGLQKYIFPKSSSSNVILDLNHRDKLINGEIKIIGNNEISGTRQSKGWAENQYLYYVIQFSKPFQKFGIMKGKNLKENARDEKGNVLKAYVSFNTEEGEEILVKVGVSAVSVEGARKNLEAEQTGWHFNTLLINANYLWNEALHKIEFESNDLEILENFYTAMYHAMIAPNTYQDVDGQYRGRDLKVHQTKDFNYYTVFSLWDTYRALHPLLTLIDKKRSSDFVNTFITQYEQGGRLPVWELSACETNCMIGYHSVPVIAEAMMKDVKGFDAEKALEAMKHSAMEDRNGLKDYKKLGYIRAMSNVESVSKTLEYAYDDWCIAICAKKLGKTDDYNYFIKRALNYKSLFDPSTNFMRPKNDNFIPNFDPYEVSHNYTEGNAWQYSFYVPQDISGHMKLMGGKEKLSEMLDSIFHTSSTLRGISLPDISGMIGQYAHGNEPSHQIAYEYDYAGQAWKTQQMVRKICRELYHTNPTGLSGNEDCGQMSAWYILSALGFYAVCPGSDQYAIGSPMMDKATIHLENGKTFMIKAHKNNAMNVYIQSAILNGKTYNKSFLLYSDIANGGELEFEMGPEPNKNWGTTDEDVPVSKID